MNISIFPIFFTSNKLEINREQDKTYFMNVSNESLGIGDHHENEKVLRSRAAESVNRRTKVTKVLSVDLDNTIPRSDVSGMIANREYEI